VPIGTAGGAVDLVARTMARYLSDQFHQEVDDAQAAACGLINQVAPDSYALSLARNLARNSPRAVSLTKQLVLAERRRRIAQFAADVDRARTQVTDSAEYRDVVEQKPGAGRARAGAT
jgi:enoyl-CoA hydratase/carnithine racemase